MPNIYYQLLGNADANYQGALIEVIRLKNAGFKVTDVARVAITANSGGGVNEVDPSTAGSVPAGKITLT